MKIFQRCSLYKQYIFYHINSYMCDYEAPHNNIVLSSLIYKRKKKALVLPAINACNVKMKTLTISHFYVFVYVIIMCMCVLICGASSRHGNRDRVFGFYYD